MINKTIISTSLVIGLGLSALLWYLAYQNSQIQMLVSAEQQRVDSLQSLEQTIRDFKASVAVKPKIMPAPVARTTQAPANDSTQDWRQKVDANITLLSDQMQGLSGLANQLQNLTAELDEIALNVANANLPQADVPAPPIQPELSAEQKAEHRQAQITSLEYRLTDLAQADEAWSSATETAISEAMSSKPALMVASSHDMQCGGNVCKVSATMPSGLSALEQDSLSWSLSMLNDDFSGFSSSSNLLADGSREIVYYYARTGHSLRSGPH